MACNASDSDGDELLLGNNTGSGYITPKSPDYECTSPGEPGDRVVHPFFPAKITCGQHNFSRGDGDNYSPIFIYCNEPFPLNNLFACLANKGCRYVPYGIRSEFLANPENLDCSNEFNRECEHHPSDSCDLFIGQLPFGMPGVIVKKVIESIIGETVFQSVGKLNLNCRVVTVNRDHSEKILALNQRIYWDLFGVWVADTPATTYPYCDKGFNLPNVPMVIEPGKTKRRIPAGVASPAVAQATQINTMAAPDSLVIHYPIDTRRRLIFTKGPGRIWSPIQALSSGRFLKQNIHTHTVGKQVGVSYVDYVSTYEYVRENFHMSDEYQSSNQIKNPCSFFIGQVPADLSATFLKDMIEKITGDDIIAGLRKTKPFIAFITVDSDHSDKLLALNHRVYWDLFGVWVSASAVTTQTSARFPALPNYPMTIERDIPLRHHVPARTAASAAFPETHASLLASIPRVLSARAREFRPDLT